jgi:predicted Fe-Mo cluster-binding NifX family protein
MKRKKEQSMRIVIPLADGKLTNHFGHCKKFALVDIDPGTKAVLRREDIDAPPHEPGLLPSWLAERGVTVVIAGGMGQRALGLFAQQGINVVTGAPLESPERIVKDFLAGELVIGTNACDH